MDEKSEFETPVETLDSTNSEELAKVPETPLSDEPKTADVQTLSIDADETPIPHEDADEIQAPESSAEAEEAEGVEATGTDSDASADSDTNSDVNSDAAQNKTPLESARSVIGSGVNTVNEGISAVRQVSEAKRAYTQAKDALESINQELSGLKAQLEHRQTIERTYDEIIDTQNSELADAQLALNKANEQKASLENEKSATTQQLDELKASNEQEIAPHRELANTAKGTLDDAERNYRDARRALKVAKSQANDAQSSHDARISNANRAVDNAANRLARLQDQLAEMKRDSSTGTRELSEMSGGVAAALAQLENAREDVVKITNDCEAAVQNTTAQLTAQQQYFDEAEASLKTAQDDERTKRDTYNKLKQQADSAEKQLSDKIAALEKSLSDTAQAITAATSRITTAQNTISEAQDIHNHPEVTQELANTVASTQQNFDAQTSEVERLASEEETIRESTKKTRMTLYAAIAIAVVLIIVLIWLLFFRN